MDCPDNHIRPLTLKSPGKCRGLSSTTMRYLFAFSLLITVFALYRCIGPEAVEKHEQSKRIYRQDLERFAQATDSLVYIIEHDRSVQWQPAFQKARLAYKAIEILTDYYYTTTAKAINGPPVTDVESEDYTNEIAPTGFQVMEEGLFPSVDTAAQEELLVQAKALQSFSQRLQNGLASLHLSDTHVFDALRLQLLRLVTIGLSGADNGIAQNSIPEAVVSLQSFLAHLSPYAPSSTFRKKVEEAIGFLQANPSFVEFNRAAFLVDFAAPLWNNLHVLQKERLIPFLKETGLVNTNSSHLFDSAFFNAGGFSRTFAASANASIIQLGEQLFSEKRLSGTGNRSCATCHQPALAYTDGMKKASSIDGKVLVFRNTPTVLYASLQPLQFADGRISFLDDQAKAVIENHSEMKGNLRLASHLLSKDTAYRQLAGKAFHKNTLNEEDIAQALASFIEAKTPFRSPFDRYLRGEKDALSSSAIQGFNLFMGKAKCGTCHFMPLFNGVVPPHFSKMESEVLGTPIKNTAPFTIDPDEGRFRFTAAPIHRFAFKTPTLRNIAVTAPYMHNGLYKTLEEIIDFYDKGGGAGLGIALPNQTLPAEKLALTKEEKQALINFMQSLTDK